MEDMMTDTMTGGDTTDTMTGGDTTDTMTGGDTTDTMTGGDMTDTMTGGDTTDTMTGGDTTDTMTGGDMTDTMTGGEGNDEIDTMTGGDTTDTVTGGDTTDDSDGDTLTAIIGVSTGSFTEPSEPDDDADIDISSQNGSTDNRFEWGVAVEDSFRSVLQVDGADFFGAKPEEEFKVGQIFYQNGTIRSGTGFNGEFGFSLELDIDGTDDDPAPFEFFFDILNTPNDSGDPVEDADRLRFVTSGLSPSTFEVDGNVYTLELLGFSQDGGETFENGFDSPEEGFDIASIYGKLIQVSGGGGDDDDDDDDDDGGGTDFSRLFVQIEQSVVVNIQAGNGVFIGSDGSGNGAIAGSVLVDSSTNLNVIWSNSNAAEMAFEDDDTPQLDGTEGEVDLDDLGTNEVVGSDGDDTINCTDDNDAVDGGGGNDEITCDSGNDVAVGGEGDDMVSGGDGIDVLNGNMDDDMVMGGNGDDYIRGGRGNDMVMGEDGDDLLYGDFGFDILIGGGGSDIFGLRGETDINVQASLSTDLIADFEGGVDRIAISASTRVSFKVGDFNSDGVDDVGIELESGFLIGAVLNTSDTQMVSDAIQMVPEGDFLA